MDDQKCSFCFQIINFHDSIMANCNTCTVKYHKKCLEELNVNGWICPICRKRNDKFHQNNNDYIDFFFNLFMLNPNICTFIIFFITSTIITFVYVIPHIMYVVISDYIKAKMINFRNEFIVLET